MLASICDGCEHLSRVGGWTCLITGLWIMGKPCPLPANGPGVAAVTGAGKTSLGKSGLTSVPCCGGSQQVETNDGVRVDVE